MAKTYKAVIIGAAHMHSLYMAWDLRDNPRADLMGIADTPALIKEHPGSAPFTRKWNLDYITKRVGVPFFEDYRKMLDEVKPDMAFVTTETPLHTEVFEECAQRGIVVSVEKPMATSLSEGLKMYRIAKKTGAKLLVNWPLAWMPFMEQFKQILSEGRIGNLLKVRQLVGHPGPLGKGVKHPRVEETSDKTTPEEKAGTWWHNSSVGGGAMLDFCCYGAMSCNWLVGQKATSVMGMRCNTNSQWADADDNAAMLVSYPGCLAVLEGSWTVPAGISAMGPELYGSEGMAYCDLTKDGVVVKINDFYGNQTALPPLEPLPHMRNVTTALVHHLDTGEPLPSFLDIDVNIEVLAILDAGVRSAKSGKLEVIRNIAWEIG
jgi:predicted dehydrogenase